VLGSLSRHVLSFKVCFIETEQAWFSVAKVTSTQVKSMKYHNLLELRNSLHSLFIIRNIFLKLDLIVTIIMQ